METATGEIEVVRGTELWGVFRRLSVYLDGRSIDRMKIGTKAVLVTSPGPHTVQVRMDWVRSDTVAVVTSPESTSRLVVTPPARPSLFVFSLAKALVGRSNPLGLTEMPCATPGDARDVK